MLNLNHFIQNRSGNVAMLFSLALFPAIGLIGLSLDYSSLNKARAKAQAAVDTAVLEASQDLTGASDAVLGARAKAIIASTFGAQSGAKLKESGLKTVGTEYVVTASFTVPTLFSSVMGVTEWNATVSSASPKRVGRKQDMYFLLDASASMGLAADEAGRGKLKEARNCSFACHELEADQIEAGIKTSNLQYAMENGIQTRVDILRDAVTGMIDSMAKNKTPLDTFRVAVESFDDQFYRDVPLTSDLTSARNFIASNYKLKNNTSFSNAMPNFTADVGSQGDGVTTPKKFALLVTDGVQGRRDRAGGFRPFDSKLCDTVKGQGVTLIVLNTKYIAMTDEPSYEQTIGKLGSNIQDKLEPALQACASSGWYYSGQEKSEILAAFNKIEAAMLAAVRLSK